MTIIEKTILAAALVFVASAAFFFSTLKGGNDKSDNHSDFITECRAVGFNHDQCLFFRYASQWRDHAKDDQP